MRGFINLIKGTKRKAEVENKILAELDREVADASKRTTDFIQQLPLDTTDREHLTALIAGWVKAVSIAEASRGLYLKPEG